MGSCCPGSKSTQVEPEQIDGKPVHVSTRSRNRGSLVDKYRYIFPKKGRGAIKSDITSEYIIGSQIGQPGRTGIAKECVRKSDEAELAVKVIGKSQFLNLSQDCIRRETAKAYEEFRTEIKIMKNINHPNLVSLCDVFEDGQNLYIVMEKCIGGELCERITAKQRYSEKDAASILREFAKGIESLHKNHIAHCDLKPSNILFLNEAEDSPIKIIDFGMSKHTSHRKGLSGFRGTCYFVAPEILLDDTYTYHCDIWSFGVIVFLMLFGFPPFFSRNGSDTEIYNRIKKGFCPEIKDGYGPWFPLKAQVTDAARDLITRCLEFDPVKRYTATEVLEHPWITGQAASGEPLVDQVLKNLHEFTRGCAFKAAVLDTMTEVLTDVELDNLRKTFKSIDLDGDGQITTEELKYAVETQLNLEKSGEIDEEKLAQIKNFEKLILTADINNDGMLSYDELVATCVQRKIKLKQERMDAAFNRFDKDGDGHITRDEVKQILLESGRQIGDEELDQMVAEVDLDGDGQINKKEFLLMWSHPETVQKIESDSPTTVSTKLYITPCPSAPRSPASTQH